MHMTLLLHFDRRGSQISPGGHGKLKRGDFENKIKMAAIFRSNFSQFFNLCPKIGRKVSVILQK